jgi:hypothetical protein
MVGATAVIARKGNGNGERSALAAAITKARQARIAVTRRAVGLGGGG